MAAFGTAAYADEQKALNGLLNAATAAGYNLDTDIGPVMASTAILASMLVDTAPFSAISVGGGTTLTGVRKITATLTPAAVAANTAVEQTFTTFSGLTTADTVTGLTKPTAQGGLALGGIRVVAADNLGINFVNVTGSAITPTAGQAYTVLAFRS